MTWTVTAGTLGTGITNETLCQVPAGVSVGDLLVAFVMCDRTITFTIPSGWTEMSDGISRVVLAYKIADGTESDFYWSSNGASNIKTIMVKCSTADGDTPFEDGGGDGTTSISLTFSNDNTLCFSSTTANSEDTAARTKDGTGWTDLFNDASNSFRAALAYKVEPAGTYTTELDWTFSGTYRLVAAGFNIGVSPINPLFFGSNF